MLIATKLSANAGFVVINGETLSYKAVGNQLQITNAGGANVLTLDGDDAAAALATIQAATK